MKASGPAAPLRRPAERKINRNWLQLATAPGERANSNVVQLAADTSPPDELRESVAAPLNTETEGPEEREEEGTPPIQLRAEGADPRPGAAPMAERVSASLGSGSQLEASARGPFERFFGHDFTGVRVHADGRAAVNAERLGARAFTLGEDVGFAANRYAPRTLEGAGLLAHELTHVVQQARGVNAELRRAGIGAQGDAYEREADENADRFVRGEAAARMPSQSPGGTAGGDAVQLYSGADAASYARTWATDTNPDYPRFSNDCTNFVSQALLAGGWPMMHSPVSESMIGSPGLEVARCEERTLDSVWWYGDWYCLWPDVRASYTWAGAANLAKFMTTSGRGSAAGAVRDLRIGDVLQMDFGDGAIHHSMIVTDKRDGELYLSYHTSDHLDEPFWAPGGILERNPDASYYAWRL